MHGHESYLEWRGIGSEPCIRCDGSGYMVYGSTSTYWGGIGGAAMTRGVCNKCWGSGEKNFPWPSHKEFYNNKKQLEKLTAKNSASPDSNTHPPSETKT